MITVILNGYKRPDYLNEQLMALESQSVRPTEILLWYNHPGDDNINYDIGGKIPTAYNNTNYGVWARFYFGFNAKNPHVCVFDDDTIPGSRWLENCLTTMQTHEGLLGTVGLKYQSGARSYFDGYVRYGWCNPQNTQTAVEVDFVGHSWFFKKEWLSTMVRELPDPKYKNCGEDMHFSYMLQKYAGIKTFVPPHPPEDTTLWGSLKGMAYGEDDNALWKNSPNRVMMNEYFANQREAGWTLVTER
jgi:hypothetical protein